MTKPTVGCSASKKTIKKQFQAITGDASDMLKQVANKLEPNLLVEDINYFLRPQQRKVRLLFLLASKVSDVTGSIEFGFQYNVFTGNYK